MAQNLLYKPLPSEITEGISVENSHSKKKERADFVTKFLKKTVPNATIAKGAQESLLYKRHVLDNPTSKKKYDKRAGRRKTLTCREKKALGLFKIPPDQRKYQLYLPLHELWKEYIRKIIDFSKLRDANKTEAEMTLLKADYHGAVITVTRSTNKSLMGAGGIVVQELKNVFKVVTKEDRLLSIPKYENEFTLKLDSYAWTILGTNFRFKASERIRKSFKQKSKA